jgi:hypothetical protein
VAKTLGTDLEKVAMMDAVADDMIQRGVEAVLHDRRRRCLTRRPMEEDDFKFNPFGIVQIDQR